MKYTDMSKQKKYLKKKDRGLTKFLLLLMVVFVIGLVLYIFRDRVKQTFNPISVVGSTSTTNLKQTDGRTNILILGSDKRDLGAESGRGTLTDTILVASIGTVENDVVLISLPRDLWINNYTLENGYTYSSKINEVYINSGMEELEKQIEVVLGIPIHYHVLVTFNLFEDVINTLGGIDVNVENSFVDYEYPVENRETDTCGRSQEEIEKTIKEAEEKKMAVNYINLFPCRYEKVEFTQGLQNMDGKIALKYVRSRHGNNNEGTDFSRSKRQQNVITAIKDKALSLKTLIDPMKLKGLYDSYAENVKTNIDFQALQGFYLLSRQLDFNKVVSVVLDDRSDANDGGLLYHPTDSTLYGGAYVLVPQTGDYSQIHAFVQKYIFGEK